MRLRLDRLRLGEVVVGAASVALLVDMFALPWYGTRVPAGRTAAILVSARSFNGWHGLTALRWLMLLTALTGCALAYFQARERAPAIPVSLSVIVTVLAFFTTIALIDRVLINVPGSDALVDARAGAYIGLGLTIAIFVGGVLSMRREGILEDDGPGEIPLVRPGAPA